MKEALLELTRSHARDIASIKKRIERYSGLQIQAGTILVAVQAVAAAWFDKVRSDLQAARVSAGLVTQGTDVFEMLLRQSKQKPSKSRLLSTIESAIIVCDEIIHTIEISPFAPISALSIAPYIEGLADDEGEYLDEAQRCLTVGALRACIVLGWCATIARIHVKIGEFGYDNFSKATADMAAKSTGRFKPFNKKYDIGSLSELQRVFDTDLLWVLEFMEWIDGNQHQRLRHCFEFRNNSAHPGLATIKGENLYSFYSDISEIVLKSEKFKLQGARVTSI